MPFERSRRWLLSGVAVFFSVIALGVILHVLIPEDEIHAHSHPIAGDVLINEVAGERVVFRDVPQPGSDGRTIIDVFLKPQGSVPVAHVHPETIEVFTVIHGRVRIETDGQTHQLSQGDSLTVRAGAAHALGNPHARPAHVRVEMGPTRGLNLALAQVHGYLNETGHRGGLHEFLQMLRFADRYAIYKGGIPVSVQRVGITLIAPFARALGFRGFYERYATEARRRNPAGKDAQ